MRHDVEPTLRILVQGVVAGADPVAVVVDQGILDREEAQGSVDVEDRGQRRLELFGRGLVQDAGQLDQVLPGLLVVLALQVVDLLVGGRIVAEVCQRTAAIGAAGDLPAASLGRSEELLREVFVELLGVGVDAPVLAVDDHPDEVRLRSGQVFPRDVAVEHGAQEGRILMGVEQVEGLVPVDGLFLVGEIQRDVQRAFPALAHREVGRRAPEMDPDLAVGPAIDRECRRHLDVGVVEVGQCLLPVGAVELQEEGPKDALVVQRSARVIPDLGRGQLRPRRRLEGLAAATGPPPTAGSTPADPTSGFLLGQEFPGGLAFLGVEALIPVLVELGDQKRLGGRTRSAGSAGSAGSPGASRAEGGRATEVGRRAGRSVAVGLGEAGVREGQGPQGRDQQGRENPGRGS